MKWSDLEPGDVLRVRDEVRDFYHRERSWVNYWCNKGLVVKDVIVGDRNISIGFDIGTGRFDIDHQGFIHFISYDGLMFDIVRLKDE